MENEQTSKKKQVIGSLMTRQLSKELRECPRYEDQLRHTSLLKDTQELEGKDLVGKAVFADFVFYHGPVVYGGKTSDGKYTMLVKETGRRHIAAIGSIAEFHAQEPFITRGGEGLLDFQTLGQPTHYSATEDLEAYLEKQNFWEGAFRGKD